MYAHGSIVKIFCFWINSVSFIGLSIFLIYGNFFLKPFGTISAQPGSFTRLRLLYFFSVTWFSDKVIVFSAVSGILWLIMPKWILFWMRLCGVCVFSLRENLWRMKTLGRNPDFTLFSPSYRTELMDFVLSIYKGKLDNSGCFYTGNFVMVKFWVKVTVSLLLRDKSESSLLNITHA